VQELWRYFADAACVVPVGTVCGVAEDGADNLVLETAVAGDAAVLVTGDRHLQAIGRYRDVEILSPRQFLEVLVGDAGDEASAIATELARKGVMALRSSPCVQAPVVYKAPVPPVNPA
jgi:hypothetical protein